MAGLVYAFGVRVYALFVYIASLFNTKAKRWVQGRQGWRGELKEAVHEGDGPCIWVHAASLGEFEQGRPLIEGLRNRYPNSRIFLTFFSPSGYEIRKNYEQVDYVSYLPLDTKSNAAYFIKTMSPDLAVFVKYEFWFRHLEALKRNEVKTILVSGRFHEGQGFFKPWGSFFRKGLDSFNHFFLQDENSAELLKSIGVNKYTLAGDTRFDRVLDIQKNAQPISEVEEFKGEDTLVVMGSSWPQDEALMNAFLKSSDKRCKVLIAPHEIHPSRIDEIIAQSPLKGIRLSDWQKREGDEKLLVIDQIGLLSMLYQYAIVAIVGGGFGAGIHNVLEAAVWGCPVITGPRHRKFPEARALVEKGGMFPVKDQQEFNHVLKDMLDDVKGKREASSLASRQFCQENAGATKKVLDYIETICLFD